jgi:mannose-1-phosphate guanylyltransferase
MNLIPVIMAGGSGSRLWPMSRSQYPKQLLKLTSDISLLQETAQRITPLTKQAPLVICNEDHRFIVAEQLKEQNQLGKIILEPVGRNTAPAIALAAIQIAEQDPNALMLVLAADHVIKNQEAFVSSVNKAVAQAQNNTLVTFGIVPDQAETGYGYIKRGEQYGDCFTVEKFVEKPDTETAQAYLDSSDYYWNSGMFVFKASTYLEELEKYQPEILSTCQKAMQHTTPDSDFIRVDKAIFELCPDDSIDYAVMEKTEHALVVPMDAKWSDVGSWSALWEISEKDSNNNAIRGDVLIHDATNNYINAEQRLVTAVGVSNLVIVETKDAILVADKSQGQHVKKIVEQLKAANRNEYKIHREVYRPWGKYDSIDNGERYQVKRITVKPGEKLSIQMHHHRAEHWIVVSGTAKVTNGDNTFLVTENESTHIPIGVVHSLENPGKLPLEMIEVQSGSYLGEDDIVRFEDRYGRIEGVKK